MPLENDIQNLTAAINRLADVFGNAEAVISGTNATNVGKDDAPEPTKTTPKKATVTTKVEPTKATPKKVEPAKGEDVTLEAVDFEAVKTATRNLNLKLTETSNADTARQAIIDLLAEFGVAKANELKPEQYGAFITRALELMPTDSVAEDDLIG